MIFVLFSEKFRKNPILVKIGILTQYPIGKLQQKGFKKTALNQQKINKSIYSTAGFEHGSSAPKANVLTIAPCH
jgi:hypothetical protein